MGITLERYRNFVNNTFARDNMPVNKLYKIDRFLLTCLNMLVDFEEDEPVGARSMILLYFCARTPKTSRTYRASARANEKSRLVRVPTRSVPTHTAHSFLVPGTTVACE